MMRERGKEGKLQVMAAMSLFRLSGLVQWSADSARFTAVPYSIFDLSWRNVDPVFGRFVCWMNFSMAAEFLAKGVCLLCDLEVRKLRNGKTVFGTFKDLQKPLRQLCAAVHLEENQRQVILKVYKHLGSEIRNRDAHAYVPNVRTAHFDYVRDECVPCLNLLISCLPGGAAEIAKWTEDPQEYIASVL